MDLCISVDWKRQKLCLHEPLKGVIRWRLTLGTWTVEGENMATTIQIGKTQFSAGLEITDINENPAPVDGIPKWEVSDPEMLALVVAEDGMSADVIGVTRAGDAQVKVTVDADLDANGFKPITGLLDVTVLGGEAQVVKIVPGPVVPIPAP